MTNAIVTSDRDKSRGGHRGGGRPGPEASRASQCGVPAPRRTLTRASHVEHTETIASVASGHSIGDPPRVDTRQPTFCVGRFAAPERRDEIGAVFVAELAEAEFVGVLDNTLAALGARPAA